MASFGIRFNTAAMSFQADWPSEYLLENPLRLSTNQQVG